MRTYDITPDLQVLGDGAQSFMDGFGPFSLLASRILHEAGFCDLDDSGMIKVEKGAWYPLGAALRAYARIAREMGTTILYQAGLGLPKHAVFPDHIRDLEGALASHDIAYNLNHGQRGQPLFNLATGECKRLIGEYRMKRMGERCIVMECENPYPCDLDRGLLEAISRKFEPTAVANHDAKARCRKRNDDFCAYSVVW